MRRTSLWVLPILAAGLFLWWNGAARELCAEAVWPFRRASGWAAGQVSSRLGAAWRGLCDGPARDAAAEEIERLRVMLAEGERLARENAALRGALGWEAAQPARHVAAPVLDHGGGLGVWPRLTLGVGRAQGVEPGAAVVAPEGLVGRVAPGVTAHTCQVILLSDPANRVAAAVPGVARGILQGDGGEDLGDGPGETLLYAPRPLLLRYVEKEAFLPTGQQVVSVGAGGVYPAGLPIGTVIGLRPDATGLAVEALVEPAVDPTLLDVVFVRVREGGDGR